LAANCLPYVDKKEKTGGKSWRVLARGSLCGSFAA
jgi:hypothetical protein